MDDDVRIRQKLPGLAKLAFGWALFIGIGALAGVIMMWTTPERFGMTMLLEPMRRLPFGDTLAAGFGWPGLALLLVIGAPHLITGWLILRRHQLAPLAVITSGLVLLAWITLQLAYLYGPNPLSNAYLLFALVELAIGVIWYCRNRLNT